MVRTGWRKYWHTITEVPIEGVSFILGALILQILPLRWAAGMMAAIARWIGPRLRKSNVARRNLKRIYPEKSSADIEVIVCDVWDNLGRLAGEYPHLGEFTTNEITMEGQEVLDALIAQGKPAILVGAHLANWEIIAITARLCGAKVSSIYRPANNPLVRWWIHGLRKKSTPHLISRGMSGGRDAYAALKRGHLLMMLGDHKLNTGITVPFMGIPVPASPAAAAFALRLKCPIIPVQVQRLGRDSRFHVRFHPPLRLPNSGDETQDTVEITAQLNQMISGWIEERLGQWLWIHKRWK